MDKIDIINKISTTSTHSKEIDKQTVISWINSLPNISTKVKPNIIKVGDVFLHTIFKHPYVLLEKKKDCWICGLLTTEETCKEILEQYNSRFFTDGYFTKVLFTIEEPNTTQFMGVYDNPKQLKNILIQLKSIFK